MIIRRLELENFRNYRRLETEFSPHTNVIIGDNANGKTNLLEAVYLLTSGRSFRTRTERDMILFGEDSALVKAEFLSGEREQRLQLRLVPGQRKTILLNDVRLKTVAALAGKFTAVLFCPEDLDLIRAGAGERRRFLDQCISQLRPRYAAALLDFGRAAEQKTRILKDWREKPSLLELLDDYNRRLAELGAVLIRYRSLFCRSLNESAAQVAADFSGGRDSLELEYRTVSTVTDPAAAESVILEQLLEHQEAHRAAELEARQTLSGAGRDDVEIRLGGKPARSFASQGQTRTAALSMKLAEWEIMARQLGEYPVLLLDDVLSELDGARQSFVLNRITGGQVFITCCEDSGISRRTGGRVLRIENGALTAPEETEETA